jgi:hypothetical protein
VAGDKWSGVAVATLVVSALTPLAVVAIGVLVARSARRVEALQQANQTVVTRRVQVFGEVAGKLNRLLCFATFVGRWKEISAAEALGLKRDVDELVYANRLLFSDALFDAYHDFMMCLFAMYATVDGDALIKSGISSQWGDRRNLPWWEPRTESSFVSVEGTSTVPQAQQAYEWLTEAFRADLYVTTLDHPLMPTGHAQPRRRWRSR